MQEIRITFNIEKREGFGEDSDPLYLISQDKQKQVIGVFDGLGGSGSTLYEEEGKKATGAFIASRVSKEATELFFKSFIESSESLNTNTISMLKEKIKRALKEKLKKQKYEATKLKSALIRTFPTTMALAFSTNLGEKALVDILWAGDSRAYILNAKEGLIQLTKDDIKMENDPYQNIENDAPLSNVISLEMDFKINHKIVEFDMPFFLLTATDGCFGYYTTPMHFENLLLQNMINSSNIEDWCSKIIEELKVISGDDFSMSLIYLSREGKPFNNIKNDFKERFTYLEQNYMKELLQVNNEIKTLRIEEENLKEKISFKEKEKKELELNLWSKYKTNNYPIQIEEKNEKE